MAEEIISFERINIKETKPYLYFIKLTNTMDMLEKMEAGTFSVVETQWDTTCPELRRFIYQTIKSNDKYSKVSVGSNKDEEFIMSCKTCGALTGLSRRCSRRVEYLGVDHMCWWIWVDLRGK